MSAQIVDLADHRRPVTYEVVLHQRWDGSLSFLVRDVADDRRSRLAVADALRRAADALVASTNEEEGGTPQ